MYTKVLVRSAILVTVAVASACAGTPKSQTLLQGLPIRFEERPKQNSATNAYIARTREFTLILDGATQTFRLAQQSRSVVTKLLGADRSSKPQGIEVLEGKTNYFLGNIENGWRTGVSGFGRVRYPHVYPGIDLIFYGQNGFLEYDFVVAPGGDAHRIAFQIDGVREITVDAVGDLVVNTGSGSLRWHKPVVYQYVDGVRINVAGAFAVTNHNRIHFAIGEYDHSRTLTIDPALAWGTYFGGSGNESARGVGVDGAGNVYIAGYTTTQNLPVSQMAAQPAYGGHTASLMTGDAFVAKFTPDGKLAYLTYLGGSGDDLASALAVDAQGNAYVTGYTNSFNFPVTPGVLQPQFHGLGGNTVLRLGDAFVTKLDPTGTKLLYSTYLGGAADEIANAIAIDLAGNAYIAGATLSKDFPVTSGVVQASFHGSGGQPITDHGAPFFIAGDAFVAKINAQGTHLVFATYLGGSQDDTGLAIAVDGAANVYVTGATLSLDFPVTKGALQTVNRGKEAQNQYFHLGDAFLTELNSTGTVLQYSTFIGGSGDDAGLGITVDASGSAYVVGCTTSPNFPVTPGAFQTTYGGPRVIGFVDRIVGDAFVVKVNPAGTSLSYGTYLGGTDDDLANGISVDATGQAFVGGRTNSVDFPVTTDAVQRDFGGGGGQNLFLNIGDAFLAVLNPAGSAAVFSTFYGGSQDDTAQAIAIDNAGNAYIAGNTVSTNLPVTPGAFQTAFGGMSSVGRVMGDAFLTKFSGFPARPTIAQGALRFVPVTPCRVADTRNASGPFGGPSVAGQTFRSFAIPNSTCSIPSTAAAYSLNVAVVPRGELGYLTVWPAGELQPFVATLNSLDGRIKSNAAIVPAGVGGAINVFATNTTDVVLDIDGYFVAATDPTALAFYPLTPCRIADNRKAIATLGGPSLSGQHIRTFPIPASTCSVPTDAKAYSLNFAAIPKGPLGYLTAWPTGQPQPLVASLNALTGTITANAALVSSGTNGAINVFASNGTDLVIDINGYFAAQATGGLSLYNLVPCRVLDTRVPAGAQPFVGTLQVNVAASGCGVPASAQAYVFSATVVPSGALGYITMWPQGESQPLVATLNALDGAITSNMAIVPTTNGSISVYATSPTHLVLDIFGYFAP